MQLQDSSATTPLTSTLPTGEPNGNPSVTVPPVAQAPAVPQNGPVDGPQPSVATPSIPSGNDAGGSGLENTPTVDPAAMRAWLEGRGTMPAALATAIPTEPPASPPPAPAPTPAPAPAPTVPTAPADEPVQVAMPGRLPALNIRPTSAQDQADLVTARAMVSEGKAASIMEAAAQIIAQRNPAPAPAPAPAAPIATPPPAAPAAPAPAPVSSTVADLEALLLQVEIDHSQALADLNGEAAVDLVKQRHALTKQLEAARAAEAVQHQQQTVAASDWDAANAAAVQQHPQLADPNSPMHIFVQALVNRDAETGVADAGTAASFQRAVAAAAQAFNAAPAAPSVPSPQPPTRPPGVSLPGILGLTASATGAPAPSAPDAEAAIEAQIAAQVRQMRLMQTGRAY